MFLGIRLRIWILCGVPLIGALALVLIALPPDPDEIAGADARRQAAGGEVRLPAEPSRDARTRAPAADRGQPAPGSDATAWDEPGGDTTRRRESHTTPGPQSWEGLEVVAGGRTAAGPASDAEEFEPSQPEDLVDAGRDDDRAYWAERMPVLEEEARSRVDDFVDGGRDGPDATLVEMFVKRRLFDRPDENEAALYDLADDFVAEMSPEERHSMLYGFMNPVGQQRERWSAFMEQPLPGANEGSTEPPE